MSMTCKVCGQDQRPVFTQKILDRHAVQYYYCDRCGFLQTEHPYWLDEAYSDAIAGADTGLVQRNLIIARRLAVLLYFVFGREGAYADFAGGTGLLVRLMRDIGFDFYWKDRYSANIHARGFEFDADRTRCTALTAFEVLEHLEDPVVFIGDSLREAHTDTLIFTTELFAGYPPAPGAWWYYAPETGQHISFYQYRTLKTISERLGLNLYSSSGFHMMTRKTLSPMLYRLAVSRFSELVFLLLRRTWNSKTMADHHRMLKGRG
ncbi:MAG: class I SAM-dependent methyltransferase [Gammaproteobacteria bacterium]